MRQSVNKQKTQERIKNFLEVSLGLTEEQARKEAERCLQCKDPLCVKGCPVSIDIPAFIKLIAEGKPKEALLKIKERNNLPAACGRVCPQEDQCEIACILNKKKIPINPVRNTKAIKDINKISNGVNIGALERFASDFGEAPSTKHPAPSTKNLKIAVVGSGPAGLTCAADLAKMGYSVTLFESLHIPGGVLTYGIPEFRLPKKIVQKEVAYIKSLGVEIKTNFLIGKTYSLKDLFNQDFKAIFLGLGAGLPLFLGIPGENLNCIYSANEFLTRINLMKAYKFPEYKTPLNIGDRVCVIGGGNVAMDSARCALRLGKGVTLIYRRTEKEMPARIEEIENAKEEGIKFQTLTQPIKFIGDNQGFVKQLECIKMELGEPDESGRRRPIPVKDSNFILECDTVIIAIGQRPNPLLAKSTPDLKTNKDGTIWVDENLMTSIAGVFAGGDIITGADTVISAMGAGKRAALSIDKFLSKGN